LINFSDLARRELTSPIPAQTRIIPEALRSKSKNTVRPRAAAHDAATGGASRAAVSRSPAPSENFLALGDDDTAIPPDAAGAAGPNHLMTTLNTQVRIQAKDGSVVSTVSLNAFWASLNKPDLPDCFDPKIIYDPYAGRWIFTTLCNAFKSSASVLMAVTQTDDPTGNWNLFRIDADGTNESFADYPTIGFNKDWIAVSTNMFSNFFDDFNGVNIYVFDKKGLYENTGSNFTLLQDLNFDGFTICPVTTYDNTVDTLYLVEEYNGFEGLMRVSTITGPVGSEVLTLNAAFPSSPDLWSFFGPQAPQLGSTSVIDAGDGRVNNAVYRGGFIWCAHTVYPLTSSGEPSAAIQWWQIATNGTVAQRGRVEDQSGATFYSYPSMGVNSSNDVLIGFSRFSATQFASGNYVFRFGTDPVNTMRGDTVLRAGEAPYFKTNGGQVSRWGDYTSSVVDPVNDRDFWTLQQYAAQPVGGVDRWGTWWGKVVPAETGTFVSLSVIDLAASEQGINTASFQLRRTSPAGVLTVNYSVSGSAINGTDYQLLTGTATFPDGVLTTRVRVTPVDNKTLDGERTLFVSLAPGDGYSVGNPSTARINILDNESFAITSGPAAAPNPAIKGLTVQFSASIDFELKDITSILWDFGDGTEDTTKRLTVAHAFSAEGLYEVSLIVTHKSGALAAATVDVLVSNDTDNDGIADIQDRDDDNDGFPDEIEIAFGTDPLDPESSPSGGTQAPPDQPLKVQRILGKFNFKALFEDSLTLSGEFPIPAGAVQNNNLLITNVGGIVNTFLLDRNGRGTDEFSSFKLITRKQKNVIPKQNAKFQMKLADGDFQTDLSDEGVSGDVTVKNQALKVEIVILYRNTVYRTERDVVFTAKALNSGMLKEAKPPKTRK